MFCIVLLTIPVAPLSLLAEFTHAGSIHGHARIARGTRVFRLVRGLLEEWHFTDLMIMLLIVISWLLLFQLTQLL